MAVDVYSPTFSFSKDLQENETTNQNNGYSPYRLDHSLVDSPFDFAFNVDTTISLHSSSADELFSNGKILPTSVKREVVHPNVKQELLVPCLDPFFKSKPKFAQPYLAEQKKKSLKEFLEDGSEEEEEEEEANNVVKNPFWMFRRSNSLNCDRNTNQKKSVKGSWKILSRSGSTGKFLEKILEENEEKPKSNMGFFKKFSLSNSLINDQNVSHDNVGTNKGACHSSNVLRRSSSTSDDNFRISDRKPFRRSNSTGSAPNHVTSNAKSSQKVKVKNVNKGHDFGTYYRSNSVKITPILNLPSPYISRVSVDLFGMGSLFCNGSTTKDRKKKK